MSKKTKKKPSPEINIPLRKQHLHVDSIVFFVFTYLYVLLLIETRLIYHSFGIFITYPAFSTGFEFLKSHISYPGGIVEYAGNFLSQLYYFSWLGALIVTAIALLLYIAGRILLKSSAATSKLLCYIPAVILLMIYSRYNNQVTSFIALLAALWFSVTYEKMPIRNNLVRAAAFLIMFSLLYYIAGGVCFVFASLVTIYELFTGKRKILSVLFLTAAIGFYLLLRFTFDTQVDIAHLQVMTVASKPDPWIKVLLFCLYFYFPLILMGVGLQKVLAGKNITLISVKKHFLSKSRATSKPSNNNRKNKLKWAAGTALPIVILAAGILISFDNTKKKLVQVDYFAQNSMWPEVLRTARRIRPESYDIFCVHDIDRALYNTGRLGDDMFGYPQKLQALVLTVPESSKPSGRIFLKRSRLLLQLGHIGIAERDAFEYMELAGSTPAILEHLATIKLAKGQVEAAKVFLRVLSRDLIQVDRGRRMLQFLERDPELATDKTIQQIRSVIPDKDSVSFDYGADEFFQKLLEKNPNNKLAFEYLMAVYLLTGQVDHVVANIEKFRSLGYERIPRCYEEAILVYIGLGHTKINLQGWNLRPETINRIKEIDRVYRLKRGIYNEQLVRDTLGPDYADSYFLYYLFNLSRAGR